MVSDKKWVTVWGNAVSIAEHRPEAYSRNITLRYPIDIPFAGESVRITLDNFCGNESVSISAVTIAVCNVSADSYKDLSCPVIRDTICDITFHGNSSCVIQPHESIVSDPVSFKAAQGSTACISIYLSDFTLMQSAVLITGALSKGFFSIGDQTHSDVLPIFETKTTNWFYFLTNVEMLSDYDCHSIICYGDSITAQDWPDELKLRLRDSAYHRTAIVRRAASGTRVLREYSCITYDSYGLKGQNRFHHEIPTSGADILIIQQGINDIIHPVGSDINIFRPMSDLPTAYELIDGLEWYIQEAKKMNLQVFMGTLLPIYGWRTYAPFRETLRNEINEWIRSTACADGYIDFDRALCDSTRPEQFLSGFDSGDHLHPSKSAYKRMAYEVPDKLLK